MKRIWKFISGALLVILILASNGSLELVNCTQAIALQKQRIVKKKQTEWKKNSFPKEIKMEKSLRKKLNEFFSIFAQFELEPLSRNKTDEKILIKFALNFLPGNGDVPSEWRGEFGEGKKWGLDNALYCKLSAKHVELIVKKYFDKKIKKHQFPGKEGPGFGKYEKGYYYVSYICNEAFFFAQVVKFIEMGNNEFVATVDNYVVDPNWEGDPDEPPHKRNMAMYD